MHVQPPDGETILDLRTRPPVTIDLRRPIATATLALLRAAGLGEVFAVMAACNPGSGSVLWRNGQVDKA